MALQIYRHCRLLDLARLEARSPKLDKLVFFHLIRVDRVVGAAIPWNRVGTSDCSDSGFMLAYLGDDR